MFSFEGYVKWGSVAQNPDCIATTIKEDKIIIINKNRPRFLMVSSAGYVKRGLVA